MKSHQKKKENFIEFKKTFFMELWMVNLSIAITTGINMKINAVFFVPG